MLRHLPVTTPVLAEPVKDVATETEMVTEKDVGLEAELVTEVVTETSIQFHYIRTEKCVFP